MEENFDELLLKYTAALKTLETQISILLQDFEYKNNYNPVEHVKTRIKSYDSIVKKLKKKGYSITTRNIENHVHDVIGMRIVCSFLSDVYKVVRLIENCSQIEVYQQKDYITNPKDSGYASYHLLVYIPVNLLDGITLVEAEIQVRTIAMDFWASLEHKLSYKFQGNVPKEIKDYLYKCATDIHTLDQKMLNINQKMQEIKDK